MLEIRNTTLCIESTKTPKGRPVITVNGKQILEYRHVWQEKFGPLGDLHVCHRCDNPRCIRVEHLFAGTNADNVADRDAKGRRNESWYEFQRNKTHCKNGHEFTENNTYRRNDGKGKRDCKTCRYQRVKAYRERRSLA